MVMRFREVSKLSIQYCQNYQKSNLQSYSFIMQQEITIPTCYECNTTQNIKLFSQYTAICQKCYDRQAFEAKYYKQIRQKDPQIDLVQNGIYIGNQDAATTQSILMERQITAICSCGLHLQTPFLSNPKYTYKIYEIDDYPKQVIKHFFEDHYLWMKQMKSEGRNILVHCAAGISRSASFTIAYFMREKGIGFKECLQFVRNKRQYVCPNSGFAAQLMEYEEELKQKDVISQ